ncbi:Phosphatidylserine decarboxylase proenzyme [Desulfovibrionales bacterium]
MHAPSYAICREGLHFILFAILATLAFAALGWGVVTFVALLATAFCLIFFRDPERVVPTAPGLAVSPADGKVIEIGLMPDPVSGQDRLRICVFMNVFNVHVNRMAMAGRVHHIVYHPGKFFNAVLDKASADNERCILALETSEGERFTLVQIAGLIARRIVCWAEEGDELGRGQRFGFIQFGSRVDLYLPRMYEVSVRVGDKVLAGQTILARRSI